MSKNRNLKFQFLHVIERNFKEGMDKHSIKKLNKENNKIYSYADRKNLIDTSSEFSNWMKENHPNVKMIKDINNNHIQEFLEDKRIGCSDATLKQYASRFRKLETLTNKTYGLNNSFSNVVVPSSLKTNGKIRNVMFSDSDFNKMIKSTTNQNLKNAMFMSKYFGLRAAECSKLKYTDLQDNKVYIADSKGKRSRIIYVENKEQLAAFNYIKEQAQYGRVCNCQTGSLQQAFNRECKKNNIEIKNGAFHTLRKNFATNKFKEYRQQGLEVQEALDRVSKNLGHNENRNKLMKQYICCPIK